MKNIALVCMMILASSVASARVCAVLGEHHAPSYSSESLFVRAGEHISALQSRYRYDGRTWDNAVSNVQVSPGCTLVAYRHENFNRDWRTGALLNGFRFSVSQDSYQYYSRTENLYGQYNDTVSSVRCYCR